MAAEATDLNMAAAALRENQRELYNTMQPAAVISSKAPANRSAKALSAAAHKSSQVSKSLTKSHQQSLKREISTKPKVATTISKGVVPVKKATLTKKKKSTAGLRPTASQA